MVPGSADEPHEPTLGWVVLVEPLGISTRPADIDRMTGEPLTLGNAASPDLWRKTKLQRSLPSRGSWLAVGRRSMGGTLGGQPCSRVFGWLAQSFWETVRGGMKAAIECTALAYNLSNDSWNFNARHY